MKRRSSFRVRSFLCMLLLFVMILTGCDKGGAKKASGGNENKVGTRDATPVCLVPSADGTTLYEAEGVAVDLSHGDQGYVMVSYSGTSDNARMIIDAPSGAAYQYRLTAGKGYETFPLSEGSGAYTIGVYENISGDQYATVFSQDVSVQVADENKIFLYPNQFVDFTADTKAVAKGQELAKRCDTDLEVVTEVYNYVVNSLEYDYDKAKTVKSGYLPSVDATLSSKKGICFDYASLMATMLRSQRIPTKLQIGYQGEIYHAWISVYLEDQGWVDGIIYFDGHKWSLMDPTLASTSKESTVKEYMENTSKHYDVKYVY